MAGNRSHRPRVIHPSDLCVQCCDLKEKGVPVKICVVECVLLSRLCSQWSIVLPGE